MNQEIEIAIHNKATSIEINGLHTSEDDIKNLVEQCQQLEKIHLTLDARQSWFDFLLLLPNLIHLELSDCSFPKKAWLKLCEFKKLTRLKLYGNRNIDAEFFHHLIKLENLQTLLLFDNDFFEDHDFESISKLKNLTSLILRRTDTSDEALKHVGMMIQLTSLKIFNCSFSDEGISHLASLKNLEILKLIGNRDSTKSIKMISQFKNLRELSLSQTINDSTLKYISNLEKLEKLYLKCCSDVTSKGFSYLTTIKNLKWLDFYKNFFMAGHAFNEIKSLTQLTHLGLNDIYLLDDKVLLSIAQLKKLEFLSLQCCSEITDLGVKYISSLPLLKILDLGFCKLTDSSIQYLRLLPQLRELYVDNCKKITAKKFEELEKNKDLIVHQSWGYYEHEDES